MAPRQHLIGGRQVRPRRRADLPACVAVLEQVHHADGYPEQWQLDPAGWLDPDGTVAAWVAVVEGVLVGHVCLVADPPVPGPAADRGATVSMSRLFVSPAAQGQGVARLLIGTALAWATERDLGVVLEVHAGTAAVAVYERLGWHLLFTGPAGWISPNGTRPTLAHYAAPV